MKIEFGVGLEGAGSGAQGILDTGTGQQLGPIDLAGFTTRVRAAEELGFPAMYLADSPRYPDSIVEMTYVAGITTRLKVRTTVIVPMFFQKHPVHLAKQLATLDQMSQGRAGVAFGTGPMDYRDAYLGYPFAERGKILDEYIKALRMLWTEPKASYECPYFSFKDVNLYPKPLQQPFPIWIGGRMPPATRRMGRLGDGCMAGSRTIEDTKAAYDLIRSSAEKAGRSLDAFQWGESLSVSVAPTKAEALAIAAVGIKKRPTYAASESWIENFDEISEEDWLAKYCIVGTPEECVERISAYVDLGARFFRVAFPRLLNVEGRLRMMRLFAEKVMPKF